MVFSVVMNTSSVVQTCLVAFHHGGLARTYRIYNPGNHDTSKPAPLVLLFHGWGSDEDEFLDDRTVRQEASRRGYVLVAPRGLGSGEPDNSNNSWSWKLVMGFFDGH
jgi:poly(3-hydroxybutyrate) depolymerase